MPERLLLSQRILSEWYRWSLIAWLCTSVCVVCTSASAQDAQNFELHVKPLLVEHCTSCHNVDQVTSGVRVDQLLELSSAHDERFLRLWQSIRHQLSDGKMPPKEEPQPGAQRKQATLQWIDQLVQVARSRPSPKNGLTRRLTVAQYRNTLSDLLDIDEDLTKTLPPDAVSRDGFLNNKETLQLSPLLLEAYFQIAGQALDTVIVDPATHPVVQTFQVDLGRRINTDPCPDELILGALNHLLRNEDFVVRELKPANDAFTPFTMQTKFRFIEGYAGNDTVRGWREYDSIYHAVFACMRGSEGYPKGHAYSVVRDGLLLRPAIPSVEEFQVESTYGPKANFKISLRELPDHGRFRVTVTAAKYNDALMLDKTDERAANVKPDLAIDQPESRSAIDIPQAGVYRIDLFRRSNERENVSADASRLANDRIGHWSFTDEVKSEATPGHDELVGRLEGESRFEVSPFGRTLSVDGQGDAAIIPRHASMNVGSGDFTVAAWINPRQLQQGGLVCLGKYGWTHGWLFDMPDNQGRIRLETAGPQSSSSGTVSSPPGVIVANRWQHVAVVVHRGDNATRLFVNGFPVAKGTIQPVDLDNPNLDLHIGRIPGGPGYNGQIDEVALYRRALDDQEIQALVEPGREFARPPVMPAQDVRLTLGEREFSGKLEHEAFLMVRLPAGQLGMSLQYDGADRIERMELTRALATGDLVKRFETFEKRTPKLGVHLGLRRDCGSTLSRVGHIQTVASDSAQEYVFEGAINDFPSPDVEKDNVNYLAGLREIGVRSEYTDARDMPRLLIKSIKFEGPIYDSWPPSQHVQIMLPREPAEGDEPYASRVLTTFAQRAWRRPLREAEKLQLLQVYARSRAEGQPVTQSLRDALQVILTSPQFLFLIESSATPQAEPLDDYELASKLSYFLWNSPPDAQLLSAAASGSLRLELDQHVQRMLQDSRAQRFTSQFVTQWLALDKFQVLEADRARFPKLTPHTRAQLAEEPVRFIDHLLRENLSVGKLIESDMIVANEVVADYYGLAQQTESGFEFVPVKARRRDLGGVLSQAAILAGLSDGRQANPIKRGAWLARRIIAEPPDDPPPNVPNLKQETEHLPLRERLEMHRNQSGCAQCHAKIDPYGIALEEFDAGGRWKSEPVDSRSRLPDGAYVAGANDLKRYLANDRLDQVAFSFMKHLTIYACGRDLTYYELELLRGQCQQLKPADYPVADMLRSVIHSPIFLEK